MSYVTSQLTDEKSMKVVTSATFASTQLLSNLCPRCSGIFMNSRVCKSLIEISQESPYRIEHHTISELRKCATYYGCALCSILSRESQSQEDDDTGTFFEICPAPPTAEMRSEIIWKVSRSNDYGQPVHVRSLYVFAKPESPISTMLQSRPMLRFVVGERATARIERAFGHCLVQHEGCPGSKVNILPSRVIDVEMMYLHEAKAEETGTYAALSYCWGGEQEFKTTRSNIPSKRRSIMFGDLPRTLQDAVRVCRQLEIRYLWIDSLCILQDDDVDKAFEISRMADIYSRATLVIAASRAKTASEGFLADIEVPSREAVMLPARFSEVCEGAIGLLPISVELSGHEPLNLRGWAYQEINLASRALIYTDGGVIWQCNAVFDRLAFDGVQMGSHPSDDLVVTTAEIVAGPFQAMEWDQLVRTYSLRNITNEDDRLEAVAGIAAKVAPLWNSKYYAGLWELDMESQLGWRLESSAESHDWKFRNPQAPSWSWAAVDAPVCNVVRFDRSETSEGARVISCIVTPAQTSNPFGRVLSGRLTIEAFLVEARKADPSWLADTMMDSNAEEVEDEDLDEMWCLLLGCAPENGSDVDTSDGLLLTCLPDGTFKRLGHFRQAVYEEDSADSEASLDDSFPRFELERLGHFKQEVDEEDDADNEAGLEDSLPRLAPERLMGAEARFNGSGSRRTIVIV